MLYPPDVLIMDPDHPINRECVLWAPLQEGGGTVAHDISGGYNHTGEFEGGLAESDWTTNKHLGSSIGPNCIMSIDIPYTAVTDDFAINFGHRDDFDETHRQNSQAHWQLTDTQTSEFNPWSNWAYAGGGGGGWACDMKNANIEWVEGGSGVNTRTAVGVLANDRWQFIVTTYNGDRSGHDKVHIYTDGQEPSSYSDIGTISSTLSYDGNSELVLGQFIDLNRCFTGALTNFRWWNRELSHREVLQLYYQPWTGLLDTTQFLPGIAVAAPSTYTPQIMSFG